MEEASILFVLLSAITGAIISQIFTKLRNRTATLFWERSYQRLATSEVDPHWGNLKVLYNGYEQKHLSFISIQVSNNSNRDLENIKLRIDCIGNSWITLSRGYYAQNGTPLFLTDEYSSLLENQVADSLNRTMSHREYKIPVLNRDTSIAFDLLISSTDNDKPIIEASCIHKSVKMKFAEPRQKILNEDLVTSSLIGIFITILTATAFIVWENFLSVSTIVILITIISLSATLIGAITIKTYKFLLKLF
ncbi:MAG: hypothetical protein ABJH08_12190 [Balneola sp.]